MNIAYYCSGHGYGHATRVSALAGQLMLHPSKPTVHIVSSAPAHVFSDSLKLGARYRNATVDPVIQQPLAYKVDRKKSLQVLKAFLDGREELIATERKWLEANDIDCVLSDAVFIACTAANLACLPSVLVTNFTFDSIWSYLSAALTQGFTPSNNPTSTPSQIPDPPTVEAEPDEPIPLEQLAPLTDCIVRDYRNADLLLRLPGYIPFPAFSPSNLLPAADWVDPQTQRFHPSVLSDLLRPIETLPLFPSTPFPEGSLEKPVKRLMRDAPLLVRHPTPDIYTHQARQKVLDRVGVPREFQDHQTTKILIVSFGGQVIRYPSHSRNGSRNASASNTPRTRPTHLPSPSSLELMPLSQPTPNRPDGFNKRNSNGLTLSAPKPINLEIDPSSLQSVARIATPSHLYIPGAPPASNPTSPSVQSRSAFLTSPIIDSYTEEDEPRLLPDGWIAIVCGVAKNWGEEDLPAGFYIAPKDIYMPDLTATADVLLGKLGYGTCAECVDACTPFVYVPRPLFVEEHGLRVLMENQGVGVLLPQESYEMGDWAAKIEEAYDKGKFMKAMKRKMGWDDTRKREAAKMANDLHEWLEEWWEAIDSQESQTRTEAKNPSRSWRWAQGLASGSGGHAEIMTKWFWTLVSLNGFLALCIYAFITNVM